MDPITIGLAVLAIAATIAAPFVYDWVTKQKPRDEPLPETRISVAVVTRGTDVLMVKRQYNTENLTWQFPSGQMNPGETAEHRAEREVRSETGVRCRPEAIISHRPHPQTGAHCTYVRCAYISGTAVNRDTQENSEVAWVDASQVGQFVNTDLDGEVQRYLDTLTASSA